MMDHASPATHGELLQCQCGAPAMYHVRYVEGAFFYPEKFGVLCPGCRFKRNAWLVVMNYDAWVAAQVHES